MDVQVELDQILAIFCISQFLSVQGSLARTTLLSNLSTTPCLWGKKFYFSYHSYEKPTFIAIKAALPTSHSSFGPRAGEVSSTSNFLGRQKAGGHALPHCCAYTRGEQVGLWAAQNLFARVKQTSSPDNLCLFRFPDSAWSSLMKIFIRASENNVPQDKQERSLHRTATG